MMVDFNTPLMGITAPRGISTNVPSSHILKPWSAQNRLMVPIGVFSESGVRGVSQNSFGNPVIRDPLAVTALPWLGRRGSRGEPGGVSHACMAAKDVSSAGGRGGDRPVHTCNCPNSA